jgi:hypothetical protein
LTPRHREPREESQLNGYDALIARARGAVPGLPTPALVRIRELLEVALETGGGGGGEGRRALAELERALRGDA